MFRISLAILSFALVACASPAMAQDAAVVNAEDRCLNQDGHYTASQVIAGCTFIIDSNDSPGSDRANALVLRAKQYVRDHDFQRAWPDFDRAIGIATGDDLARAYAERANARLQAGRKAEAQADVAKARTILAAWLDLQANFARSKLSDCLATNAGEILESDEHNDGSVTEAEKAVRQSRGKCANEEAAYRQTIAAKAGLRSISDSQFEESRKKAEEEAFTVVMNQQIGER